ncbi:discoidin domain-containing protein [Draconibacterium sediminis]|uniref:GH16 domain-containing protein n=1 Tax=Draconibacterium sediminis TaxID=1544798 RepID=A0A0D8J4Q3_9BACT|nr:discoidin domain-containing protein [Draconibacterium sediminis]KJF41724.1 hypothetical protein LH29_23610 [Draconibacterium sediminis]
MKFLALSFTIFLFTVSAYSQFIDEATPADVKPTLSSVPDSWVLDFSDEFDGTQVNANKWRIDNSTKSRAARPKIGIDDWRWKPENVSVANGNLILKVYKTAAGSMTNGSINSYTKYETQYGYFEARIKIGEANKGTHTAFWLQGPNMGNVDGTANDGAEIDIFESAWTGEFTKSVVHIDGYGADHQANTKQYSTPGIHDGFHTWGFYWTEHEMEIYYDGVFKVRYSDPKWVAQAPEFLWLSNGASFGLEGDQYFVDHPIGYLTETQVDYIRVWKPDGSQSANDSLLSKENWSLIYTDSEDNYSSNLATYAFDDNPYTFWHTEWKNNQPPFPHEIQIDLGDTAVFSAFVYTPRQDNNLNGNINNYEFYASNVPGCWGDPLKSGSFTTTGSTVRVVLDEPAECRYIRLVALSEINGLHFTNVAELSLVGDYINEIQVGVNNTIKELVAAVYPNPFTGEINLKLNNKHNLAGWRIYTIGGQIMKQGEIPDLENRVKINTQSLTPGVYLLELNNALGRELKLVVKK